MNGEDDVVPNRLWDLLSVEILAKSDFCYLGGYYFLLFYYLLVWLYCFLASGIMIGMFYFDLYYYCLVVEVVAPLLRFPNSPPLTDDDVVDYGNLAPNNPVVVEGIVVVDCFFY